jgi:hypothetical protein
MPAEGNVHTKQSLQIWQEEGECNLSELRPLKRASIAGKEALCARARALILIRLLTRRIITKNLSNTLINGLV